MFSGKTHPNAAGTKLMAQTIQAALTKKNNMIQKVFLLLVGVLVFEAPAAPLPLFQLKDGDRVAFLGDTLIERMQAFNHLELRLSTAWLMRDIIFRNIGWSGDTPRGVSRAGLSLLQAGREPDGEGWKQLQKQIELVKPTVVFLGYGMACSFENQSEQFIRDMRALKVAIRKSAGGPVRFVVLSSLRHEQLAGGLPSPAAHNRQLAAYKKALNCLLYTSPRPRD